jgi:Raf kinase inhibitor-like YbhB/YbcL family protein
VWNIPSETREIPEDSVPEGSVQGLTSYGKPGYGGPCPPSGTHRYFFKLFALNTSLDLPPETNADELERLALKHAIEKAEFHGIYNRS